MEYDVVIVGSGAAGLSAALYARRYALKTLVVQGEFGGETATAGSIENYPGISRVDGYDLMLAMKKQAEDFGVEMREGWVTRVSKIEKGFQVAIGEHALVSAKAVILAIGSKRRHLNLAREKELTSRGVHYCWTCDGPLYKKKIVAMVGGGDSSVKGANFLAEYADLVYLIVRGEELRAEPVNLSRMKGLGSKIRVLLKTEITELVGDKKLEKVVLSRPYEGISDLVIDGLFVEIGFDPDPTLAKQLGLELDDKGYMRTDAMTRTNIPGIFAAGDATAHFEEFKQDITAAALGSVAATSAYTYCLSLEKKA
ncbi:MAG: FAD-dependent oxidoreductase [Candidatus Wildermuthbacteria bacterium]|nr:FAD-dependent oxidoreductase [Candidatus Wildermuthbacteria bacterium]